MTAPIKRPSLAELLGAWPYALEPALGTPALTRDSVVTTASLLGARRGPFTGVTGKSAQITDGATSLPVSFTGVALATVVADINGVLPGVAFESNGFLLLRTTGTGANNFIKIESDPNAYSDALQLLGFVEGASSRGGELFVGSHVDPSRQVSLQGQLAVSPGEAPTSAVVNRIARGLGESIEYARGTLERAPNLAVVNEIPAWEPGGSRLRVGTSDGEVVASGAAASTAAGAPAGQTRITGLAGISAAYEGHTLELGNSFGFVNDGKFTVATVVGATSVDVYGTLTIPDTNNGTLTWELRPPVTDAHLGDVVSPGIVARAESFRIVDLDGNDYVETAEVAADGGATTFTYEPETERQRVETTNSVFTLGDAGTRGYVRPAGLTGSQSALNGKLLKVVEYVNATTVYVAPINPVTGTQYYFTESAGVTCEKVSLYRVRAMVDGVYEDADLLVPVDAQPAVPRSIGSGAVTEVIQNNRVRASGASFATVLPGDIVTWAGSTTTAPWTNDGTYRVRRVLTPHQLELMGEDFGAVVLNPVSADGTLTITSDPTICRAPFLTLTDSTEPNFIAGHGARPTSGFMVQYRAVSPVDTTLRSKPTRLTRPLHDDVSSETKLAIARILGVGAGTFDTAPFAGDHIDITRLSFEHDHTGRHTTVRPNKIAHRREVSGAVHTMHLATAEAYTVAKQRLLDSSGGVRTEVRGDGYYTRTDDVGTATNLVTTGIGSGGVTFGSAGAEAYRLHEARVDNTLHVLKLSILDDGSGSPIPNVWTVDKEGRHGMGLRHVADDAGLYGRPQAALHVRKVLADTETARFEGPDATENDIVLTMKPKITFPAFSNLSTVLDDDGDWVLRSMLYLEADSHSASAAYFGWLHDVGDPWMELRNSGLRLRDQTVTTGSVGLHDRPLQWVNQDATVIGTISINKNIAGATEAHEMRLHTGPLATSDMTGLFISGQNGVSVNAGATALSVPFSSTARTGTFPGVAALLRSPGTTKASLRFTTGAYTNFADSTGFGLELDYVSSVGVVSTRVAGAQRHRVASTGVSLGHAYHPEAQADFGPATVGDAFVDKMALSRILPSTVTLASRDNRHLRRQLIRVGLSNSSLGVPTAGVVSNISQARLALAVNQKLNGDSGNAIAWPGQSSPDWYLSKNVYQDGLTGTTDVWKRDDTSKPGIVALLSDGQNWDQPHLAVGFVGSGAPTDMEWPVDVQNRFQIEGVTHPSFPAADSARFAWENYVHGAITDDTYAAAGERFTVGPAQLFKIVGRITADDVPWAGASYTGQGFSVTLEDANLTARVTYNGGAVASGILNGPVWGIINVGANYDPYTAVIHQDNTSSFLVRLWNLASSAWVNWENQDPPVLFVFGLLLQH